MQIFDWILLSESGHAKTYLMPYANNKDAEQPSHPRSLISTFVVRCLDMYICYIQSFNILASFWSWAGWFESYQFQNRWRHVVAWCGSSGSDFSIAYIKSEMPEPRLV